MSFCNLYFDINDAARLAGDRKSLADDTGYYDFVFVSEDRQNPIRWTLIFRGMHKSQIKNTPRRRFSFMWICNQQKSCHWFRKYKPHLENLLHFKGAFEGPVT